MKKQNYLCVDMTTYTNETHIQNMETRTGALTMTRQGEHFTFIEAPGRCTKRNPQVWAGQTFNVTRNDHGEDILCLHRIKLAEIDPLIFADQIFVEVLRAQQDLGHRVQQ